jgi:hypothetical protein
VNGSAQALAALFTVMSAISANPSSVLGTLLFVHNGLPFEGSFRRMDKKPLETSTPRRKTAAMQITSKILEIAGTREMLHCRFLVNASSRFRLNRNLNGL